MTNTEDLADDVASTIADAPKLHELDDGETVELRIGYVVNSTFGEGVTISFHFGTKANEIHDAVESTVEPKLDKRKFRVPDDRRHGKSWNVGSITVDGDGELVDHDIKGEYLKPSEQ